VRKLAALGVTFGLEVGFVLLEVGPGVGELFEDEVCVGVGVVGGVVDGLGEDDGAGLLVGASVGIGVVVGVGLGFCVGVGVGVFVGGEVGVGDGVGVGAMGVSGSGISSKGK